MEPMRLTKHDLDEVYAVECTAFDAPWTRAMLADELCQRESFYFGIRVDGELIGYAGYRRILDEAHIMNVAVHPSYRRRGIGARLLSCMIGQARAQGLSVMLLEVRAGNHGARMLYERQGFYTVGMRRAYYSDPIEDAVLMNLEVSYGADTGN